MSIVGVERDDESECNKALELCYGCETSVIFKPFLTDPRPNTYYRGWSCSFCGENVDSRSRSSFDSEDDGAALSRWQPA